MSRSGNQQQYGQAINALTTTTKTAYTHGDANTSQEQQKARYTRQERRAHAKAQQAAREAPHGKRASHAHQKDTRKRGSKAVPQRRNTLDAVIDIIKTLKGGHSQQHAKSLESRITRGQPKKAKAEPSAQKLEKIQKRREIRAEKRKAKLALRASGVKGGEEQQEQQLQQGQQPIVEAQVETIPQVQQAIPEEDVINFDEL